MPTSTFIFLGQRLVSETRAVDRIRGGIWLEVIPYLAICMIRVETESKRCQGPEDAKRHSRSAK